MDYATDALAAGRLTGCMTSEPVAVIGSQFPRVVIPLIDGVQGSIRIVVFDWRFYPTISGSPVSLFNSAIFRAVKRGVSVRALVNNDDAPARLRIAGCEARRLHSTKLLHTKMMVLDDVKVVIGSHNYTQHAFGMNEEASVLVEMPSADNSFVRYFDALWGV